MDYERAWFTLIGDAEGMEEAISYLKGFSEEAVLSHTGIKIEVWIPKRLPQDVRNNQTTEPPKSM